MLSFALQLRPNLTVFQKPDYRPDDPCAWNMLGVLSERMGLKATAARSYETALGLCDESERDKAETNYGRILFALGKHRESIQAFRRVKSATFNSGSGLALSLFKSKRSHFTCAFLIHIFSALSVQIDSTRSRTRRTSRPCTG